VEAVQAPAAGAHRWLIQPGRLPHETLPAVIQACEVGAAPIFPGSGTRLKILEYLAAAPLAVATAKGAEGLALEAGRDLLLAEDADRFAEAVVRLLPQPEWARDLAATGRAAVWQACDWPAMVEQFIKAVNGQRHARSLAVITSNSGRQPACSD